MTPRTEDNQEEHNQEEFGTLTLPEGVDVPVRTIEPDDVPALQRFHDRLSEKTVYLRFFGSMQELSERKAKYFAHVDGVDHFALVALDPDEPDEITAVVRYDRESGSERAEYAALIEDRWQGRGLGLHLTHQLIDEARDKGVRFLYALVMRGNRRMLNLLRALELTEREHQEDNARYIEVDLQSEED